MATPSGSGLPASAAVKTPTKRVLERLCMMCGTVVSTASTYYRVEQDTGRRKESRKDLARRFSVALDVEDIVDTAYRNGLGAVDNHLYACKCCCKMLDVLESAPCIKQKLITGFSETCGRVSADFRVKRLSADSPSASGTTKSPTKRSPAPRSLFGNIMNMPSSSISDSAPTTAGTTTYQVHGQGHALTTPKTVRKPRIKPKKPVRLAPTWDFCAASTTDTEPQNDENLRLSQSVLQSSAVSVSVPLPPQLNPSEISSVQVVVNYKSGERKRTLPPAYKAIGHALCRGTPTSLAHALLKSLELRTVILDEVAKEIDDECKTVCSKATTQPSLFRQSSKTALLDWDYSAQERELEQKAPILLKFLRAAGIDQKALEKATKKTYANVLPGILTAAGTLLYMRSNRMNAHAMLSGLTLKRGNADSVTFSRLHSRGICPAYNTVIRKQEKFGENHDRPVLDWGSQVAAEASANMAPETRQPSYLIVGDNIDFSVKARHMTTTFQRKEFHMFNTIGIKNRVSAFHLSETTSVADPNTISMMEFLPNSEDERKLRDEWCVLAGRIITEHLVKLRWLAKYFPEHIKHRYSAEARKKSEVVPLGIMMENENTQDGMANIINQLHKYVPGHGTEHPLVPILSKGDLLTCERESSALENRRDGETEEMKLEGLMPAISDFHAYGNFLEVIWDAAYDTLSTGDAGTLYHARVRLKAHNVTTSPMKCVNAAEDLLQKYTKALLVAAAMKYFGMSTVEDEPTQHIMEFGQVDESDYAKSCVYDILDSFVLPSITESTTSYGHKFACHLCKKKYVTRRNLKKHMGDKHKGQPRGTQVEDSEDSVRNYCSSTLSMCMVAVDFTDARKHADGERIIMLYKFLLLFYLGAGKTKYANQTFRLLAQVKCLLCPRLAHELTWCRFVNNKGRVDSNVEPDREIEHSNRTNKDMCRGFHGHMTKKAIDRVSRSSYHVEKVLQHFDAESSVRNKSGKHNNKLEQDTVDINSLAVHLHDEEVFNVKPGRRYKAFTSVPRNWITSQVDPLELQVWMKDHLKKLTGQNMFQRYTSV